MKEIANPNANGHQSKRRGASDAAARKEARIENALEGFFDTMERTGRLFKETQGKA